VQQQLLNNSVDNHESIETRLRVGVSSNVNVIRLLFFFKEPAGKPTSDTRRGGIRRALLTVNDARRGKKQDSKGVRLQLAANTVEEEEVEEGKTMMLLFISIACSLVCLS